MKIVAAAVGVALSGLVAALWFTPGSAQAGAAQEWPLEFESGRTHIVLYQPQPESLEGDRLTARAAVSVAESGAAEPAFGAVWIDARVATDRDERTVTLLDVQVPDVRFASADDARRDELARALEAQLPKLQVRLSLDALIASLDDERAQGVSARGLKDEPPKILYFDEPATLVVLDGAPQLRPIEGSRVERIVNTPFVMLFEPSSKTYFLRAGESWVAASAIGGPWRATTPPADVLATLPSEPASSNVASNAGRIVVATEPTELIVTDGKPELSPYAGNDLLYVSNTDNDLFVDVATGRYFVLLSGRWFASPSLVDGPWTFVPADRLPAPFASIPATSQHADVRAHVAGTPEAREAVLDATIPQTAAIQRDAPGPDVTYDGDPRFQAIEGTSLRYAVNTAFSVIECRGAFYCCDQGVWYVAPSPKGPWSVCTSVPSEIYDIPPSVPLYPVTYVHVYDVQPDVVYCGYLPGYLGWYVWGPTVVWGTGWFYPGWCGAYYYPHPWTWGFAAHYSPWACSWSFGYPYGWGASPAWFAFYWGWGPHWVHDGWWCNGGFHGTHDGVHSALPRERLAKGSEQRGAQPPLGRDNLYNRRENVARRAKLASPAPAAPSARANIARRTPNDVFADRDGTVVRRAPTGAWQQRREGAWTTLEGVQPSPPVTTRPGAPERTRPALPERASPSERERPIPSLPERTRPSAPDVPRALPPSLRPESPMRSPDALERFNRARERGAQRLENFQRSRGLRPGTGARPGVRPGG